MKKIMKRTTIFATPLFIMLFALNSLHVLAQRKAPPEFSIYAEDGISTYCYQPRIKGASSLGNSFDFGFGFTGFFSQQVGIHISAGFGLLNVKSKLDLNYLTLNLEDDNHEPFELHTKLIGYNELHKTMFVSIPVMLQFQTKQKQYWSWTRTQKAGFYAQAGIKINLLFNNQYETSIDTLFNAGYYTRLNNWAATQYFAGLGKFDKIPNGSGNLDFGVMVLFSCEAGVKWRIDNNIFVYTGAFFDCALHDPFKDSRRDDIDYSLPLEIKEIPLLKCADKVNLMVVGIKVRFAFSRNQRPY